MATLVLGAVGAAVGGSFGGSFLGLSGAVVGRAVGATLGRAIDQAILGGGADAVETGRMDRLRLTGASEGTAIPRTIGRTRLSGQVVWASRFQEMTETTGGGGKGGPKPPKQTRYSYAISLAIALCEGEITRVGRIWADGREIPRSSIQMRIYRGTERQMPDGLIEAIEGRDNAPAFRGVAYVVLENLDLTPFGNRVPQLSFEVVRHIEVPGIVPAPSSLIEGVALVPGTGEYALATTAVHYDYGGSKDSANVNTAQGISDFRVSMDDLVEELPNLKSVSLVVSWFGNDLRCGHCRIRPCVEQNEFDGARNEWSVAGLTRGRAERIPELEGRPVYGGTPSDRSVIEAIRDLNARGIAVTFYPFILMDQLAGNGLPDPHGGPEQPALPWRGRITTSLAAGRPGTSDRTTGARSEVAAFFGSGAGEWSYRRFILHYAELCAQAGGVEAFCIGSEMRELTRIRGENDSFPAVEELQELAREVRRILPNAKISYAADWSEYYGYHPADTGNVHFHLDPLWAAPEIDFIGIDNYMPVADWRDGRDHADAAFRNCGNLDYIHANIEGGEGFDWYYASSEGRLAQDRVPITDGQHDEPWIFRYKDLRSWWSKPHHDRIDGIRSARPTAWRPQSKPFRFTEYGCAAIDKGANQPNKFLDVKSSESSLPRFSNGRQDDTMQMQYLRGVVSYWKDGERNPKSDIYDGRMLDLSASLVWAWDTRPWPFFPELSSYWSDAENHARGHWISGRTGNEPLGTVIAHLCRSVGQTRVDVSKVYGVVRGYAMLDVQTARADIQPLMLAYGVEASEQDGTIVFSMRADAPETRLSSESLVRREGPVVKRQRGPVAETPGRVLLNHVDSNGDFELRVADATLPGVEIAAVSQSELPLSMTRAEAQEIAERYLTEAGITQDTLEIELPPSLREQKPGHLIRLDDTADLWRIDRLEDGAGRKVHAVRTERTQYEPSDGVPETAERIRPLAPLPVDATFMDLPLLTGEESPYAPYIAVSGIPWPGTVAVHSSSEDANYRLNAFVTGPTITGVTQSELNSAMPSVFDNGPELLVRIIGGTLETVSETALLAGANAAAINDGSTQGWEIFQFSRARLVGPDIWGLSGRLRGQRGTEWAMTTTRPVGSRVVILDESLTQLDFRRDTLGSQRHFRTGPANLPLENGVFDHATITVEGEGLRPYAPAHLRARRQVGGVAASWVRRSRIGGEGWGEFDVPLGEAREAYRARVMRTDGSIAFERTVLSPELFIADGDLKWTGADPLRLEIVQVSDDIGPGAAARITLP